MCSFLLNAKYAVQTQRAKGIKAFRFCSLSLSLSLWRCGALESVLSLSLFADKEDLRRIFVGSREDKKKVEFVISRTRNSPLKNSCSLATTNSRGAIYIHREREEREPCLFEIDFCCDVENVDYILIFIYRRFFDYKLKPTFWKHLETTLCASASSIASDCLQLWLSLCASCAKC